MKNNRSLVYKIWAFIFPLLYFISFMIPYRLNIMAQTMFYYNLTLYIMYYVLLGAMLTVWLFALSKVNKKTCNVMALVYIIIFGVMGILCFGPNKVTQLSTLGMYVLVNFYPLLFMIGILIAVLLINNFLRTE